MTRALLILVVVLIGAWPARGQDRPPDFVTVGFHDVVDRQEDQSSDAITTIELTRFFDWLKGDGWTPISLDDIEAARTGKRPLPPKAVLLSFDDGYVSVYTRAYPLLLAYHYPALVAVVGAWMEGAPGSKVQYGDETVPRERFLSWEQIREMTASGLVEIASHSYALHKAVPANPQGSMQPAGATWIYDPKTGRYEDDTAFRRRIRLDLEQARSQIAAALGKPPRALVWPFGRHAGPALEEAKAAGFAYTFTLSPQPDRLDQLDRIGRLYPVAADKLRVIARELRFEPPKSEVTRIACLTLDRLAAESGSEAQDAELGRMIESVRALGANTLVIDANARLPSADAPLGAVFFPTQLRPVAADLLDRVVWQMRTRADIDAVYVYLPFKAAEAAVGDAAVDGLYADLARYVTADGLALDVAPDLARYGADGEVPPSSASWDVTARWRSVDPARLSAADRALWQAFRSVLAIRPRWDLMLKAETALPTTRWPAPLADILLLPPAATGAEAQAIAQRLRAAQWLAPTQSGRVAVSLPAGSPAAMADTMRSAQAAGVTAFAACPGDQIVDASQAQTAVFARTFSAASYPLKP